MVITAEEITPIQKRVALLPKQRRFVQDRAYEVMASGAFGTGKSRSLCYKLVYNARSPGTVHGLFRKTRAALTRTTLRTLLEPEGDLPPVLAPGSYKHNRAEGWIKLNGGGTILYAGCDQPITIASMNLVSAAIDESIEITAEQYEMILGRCRMRSPKYRDALGRKCKGPPRQVFHATNPGSPSHFLFSRFFKNEPPVHERRKRVVYQSKTTDNKFLPQDYLDTLSALTGSRYQRYVLGQWVPFEGLVYGDQWDREIHLVPTSKANTKTFRKAYSRTFLTGVDVGYTNPSVLLEFGEDGDGRIHLFREFYQSRVLPEAFTATAVDRDRKRNATHIVDPAAAGQIASFRDAGLTVIEANNSVALGIQLVMNRLAVQGDGRPRLTVSEDCENTIMEFESYAWKADKDGIPKDEPIKELDHAMDGIRYTTVHLDHGRISPAVSVAGQSDDLDDVPKDEGKKQRKKRIAKTRAEKQRALLEGDEGWET